MESHNAEHPVEVRAPRGARVMEVEWSDGSTSRIRHLVLRAFCPCAHCQGHQGPIRWRKEAEQLPETALNLDELEEVGSYALRLGWGDGHRSGLYRFDYLRELGNLENEDQAALEAHTFGR